MRNCRAPKAKNCKVLTFSRKLSVYFASTECASKNVRVFTGKAHDVIIFKYLPLAEAHVLDFYVFEQAQLLYSLQKAIGTALFHEY